MALLACDRILIPEPQETPDESRPVLATGVVSNPGFAGAGSARAGADPAAPDLVYVSVPVPGPFTGGAAATIRNTRSGVTVTTAMVDGGFDPVPVQALAGDTLEIDIRIAGADQSLPYMMVVPVTRAPVIVRTDPPPKKQDVPLNATMLIVFSEPMDIAGLEAGAIQLRTGATVVPGRIDSADPADLAVTFVPETPLAPGTAYDLVITGAMRDQDGDSLAGPATVDFVTESAAAFQLVFVPEPPSRLLAGVSGWPELRVMARLPSGATAPYDGLVTLALGSGPAGAVLSGTTTQRAVDGVATFPDVTLATPGTGYSLTATASGTAAGTSSVFDVVIPEAIAYVEGTMEDPQIFLMNGDGSGRTWLAAGDQPAWSPDGGRIAFESYPSASRSSLCESRIAIMNADGSGVTELGPGAQPAWSPDGSRIAFTACTEGRFDIFVMMADGSGVTPLNEQAFLGPPTWGEHPAWSPDGRSIAFAATPDPDGVPSKIFVVDVNDVAVRQLTVDVGGFSATECCPSWSPDGKRIAYWNYLGGLLIIGSDAPGAGLSFGAREQFYWSRPGWSPDGAWLAYAGEGGVYVATDDGAWHARIAPLGRRPAWRPTAAGASAARMAVLGFTVVEFQYPERAGFWYYAPLVRGAGTDGAGTALVTSLRIAVPGLGTTLLCAPNIVVGPGTQVDLFRELYGDYEITFDRGDGSRATGTDATVVVTFRDGAGLVDSVTAVGPVVTGGLPTTYTGGTGHGYVASATGCQP